MGEAKRRATHNIDLDAQGIPRPRDPGCPACGSHQIADFPTAAIRHISDGITCDWMGCLDCKAVWEPFPAVYARDPVCAEPCDNCAFRQGSPEQLDPERWKKLIGELRPGGSADNYGMFTGRFYCHKGIPIDMTKGPGNFQFPREPVAMDGKLLRNPDGSYVTTEDTSRMRVCSGFLRMVWSINAKQGAKNA